jgi:hypothetical protein
LRDFASAKQWKVAIVRRFPFLFFRSLEIDEPVWVFTRSKFCQQNLLL